MTPSALQLKLLTIAISLLVKRCVFCINIKGQLMVERGGCGSYLATAQITGLGDRIRHNPSTLDDNGGAAALHNSVTNFGSSTHKCGATLISTRWLLTAAHCFKGERLSGISLGRDNLDEDPSPGINTYEIEEVIIHPDYKPANYKYNDLALIRSNRVVQYGRKVWPYCLPSGHLDIHDYMPVKIAGWGRVDQSLTSSPIVKIAKIKIVENSRCDADWYNEASTTTYDNLKKYSYPNGITKQVLCAGENGVDACSGDSGGPMTHQDRSGLYSVIGIVAFGIDNCPNIPVLPGFYSNVQYFLEWIYSTTGLPRPTTTTNTQQHTPQPPGQQFARFTTPATTKRPQPRTTTTAPRLLTTTYGPDYEYGVTDVSYDYYYDKYDDYNGTVPEVIQAQAPAPASTFPGLALTQASDWSPRIDACIEGNNNLVLDYIISLEDCKYRCKNQIQCKSVEYHSHSGRCVLSDKTSISLNYQQPCQSNGWTFTELNDWTPRIDACIEGNNNLVLDGIISLGDCKIGCRNQIQFFCKSVEYHSLTGRCVLSDKTSISFNYQQPCQSNGWTFTELNGFQQQGVPEQSFQGQVGSVLRVGPTIGAGTSVSTSCRRWCRTPQGQAYCCEGVNDPLSAAFTKQGQCPPVRPSCPPTRGFAPPRQCSSDGGCTGFDKCCFDTCLQYHICTPPIGFGK